MNAGRGRQTLTLSLVALIGLGPSSLATAGDNRYVDAILPSAEVPEEQLLDIAIDLLSPSVDDHDRETLLKKGIQPSVRKAEARFIPIHLRDTLQSTGQWGAVRVVPGGMAWSELNIVGQIEKSNGKELKIRLVVWDATGKKWLDENYRGKARMLSYAIDTVDTLDPFQGVYNEIANDLVKVRSKRKSKDLVRIRKVADLRFGREFAPDTFAQYLKTDGKGKYKVRALPAEGDPMLQRLALIRERDDMFIDTLNEHYSDFYSRMNNVYDEYRANSYTEQAAYDSLNKSGRLKKILGIAAVAAGILIPAHSRAEADAKNIAIMGGAVAIQSGFKDSADSKIHKAALEELSESFGVDVSGLVVDVDGRIVELKGSAEEQFQQWREILKGIANADASLPVDINVIATSDEAGSASSEAAALLPGAMGSPVLVTPADGSPPSHP